MKVFQDEAEAEAWQRQYPADGIEVRPGENKLPPPIEEFRAIQQQLRHEMGAKTPSLKGRIQHNQKSRPKAKGFETKK